MANEKLSIANRLAMWWTYQRTMGDRRNAWPLIGSTTAFLAFTYASSLSWRAIQG